MGTVLSNVCYDLEQGQDQIMYFLVNAYPKPLEVVAILNFAGAWKVLDIFCAMSQYW